MFGVSARETGGMEQIEQYNVVAVQCVLCWQLTCAAVVIICYEIRHNTASDDKTRCLPAR